MRRTIFSQTAVLCGMFLPLFLAIAANNLFAEDYDEMTVIGEERTIGDGEGAKDTANSVTVDGVYNHYGYFYNGNDGGIGIVGTATVGRGYFYNGTYGGTGTVDTATLNNGYFYNGDGGTGTGRVDHLIYNGGDYRANVYGGTSSIGTLTLGKQVSESLGA
ncbi:MAG: hypothetical protein LBH00_00470, partial [Planctomycetaceae bacterium]|nr:hypothetical protein [Planctomycetaceae bacterium]